MLLLVRSMASVSVRIPEDLKKKMEEIPWINWSEILRQAIYDAVENQSRGNQANAILLNERVRKKAPDNWDSTDIIRRSRRRDENNYQ